MTFDIDVNGRNRMVSVERAAAGRYRVVVDGRPHDVDAARVGSFGLSLLLDGDSGVSREVEVAPAGGPGVQSVVAPMPGRVVRVLVAAGDAVTARQPVVVVEAMKMENELRSPKAGRVRDVAVAAICAGRQGTSTGGFPC